MGQKFSFTLMSLLTFLLVAQTSGGTDFLILVSSGGTDFLILVSSDGTDFLIFLSLNVRLGPSQTRSLSNFAPDVLKYLKLFFSRALMSL